MTQTIRRKRCKTRRAAKWAVKKVRQVTKGTYKSEDALLLTAYLSEHARAVQIGNEQSPHHLECALKWARKCEQRANEIEQAAQDEKGGGDA